MDDSLGCVADRANINGFAFEYMTNGRAVVLGDQARGSAPARPAAASTCGSTRTGTDARRALLRKGKGAKISLEDLDAEGMLDVQELLGHYADELRATDQEDEAERIMKLAAEPQANFIMSVPMKEQTDPSISTE